MAGFSTTAMAQTSAEVTGTAAGAKMLLPMGLEVAGTLNFGTILITKTDVVGTVGLSTAKIPTYSTSLAGLSSASSSIAIPTYSVTGTLNSSYLITLPDAIEVTNPTDSKTMTIDNFKALSAHALVAGVDGLIATLDASGLDQFTVGATLNVEVGQTGGIYTGSFDVSVDYN